jgi:predicted MarR family transcription regulator
MTERGAEILTELARRESAHEPAPTIRDLCEATATRSTSIINYHLGKLRAAGLVTWVPQAARTLRLTDEGRDVAA